MTKNNYITLKDAVEILKQAGYSGPENQQIGAVAYSLSKMTIIDEMDDKEFANYNKMERVEFVEFLSRFAELFIDGNQPLVQKIQRILHTLFSFYLNQSCRVPANDDEYESESDDPDEMI